MKRIFDFLVSAIALVILSPLFIVVAVIIKVTTKGPIFFLQRRLGKDNKEFTIIKFRTMVVDTPDVATDCLKNSEQYITPIGAILRKTSIDELPQLINILKGEMSIVGPRPILYNQNHLKELRVGAGVSKLLPGLTGWAQVNGRDTICDEEKVKLDKEYLERQSFSFDLKIIIITAKNVIQGKDIKEG